jgi:hypothetical protein
LAHEREELLSIGAGHASSVSPWRDAPNSRRLVVANGISTRRL